MYWFMKIKGLEIARENEIGHSLFGVYHLAPCSVGEPKVIARIFLNFISFLLLCFHILPIIIIFVMDKNCYSVCKPTVFTTAFLRKASYGR